VASFLPPPPRRCYAGTRHEFAARQRTEGNSGCLQDFTVDKGRRPDCRAPTAKTTRDSTLYSATLETVRSASLFARGVVQGQEKQREQQPCSGALEARIVSIRFARCRTGGDRTFREYCLRLPRSSEPSPAQPGCYDPRMTALLQPWQTLVTALADRITRYRRVAFLILALIGLPSTFPAHAAKSWRPRFLPRQGSVQYFAVSTRLIVNANLGLLGRKSGHLNLGIEVRQRVADRRRRGPTTLELTYDRIRLDFEMDPWVLHYDSSEPQPSGEEQAPNYLGRLVGQAVILVVSRHGEIVEAHGLEGLWDEASPTADAGPPGRGALLETLTQGLGLEMLKALYQQASPIFPRGRVRIGDRWTAALTIPDPAFGTMQIDSEYELLDVGKIGRHKHVKTIVRNRIGLEGHGPLLDQIGALAGAEGEVRITTERADGSGTIWTARKTGVTLGLLAEQEMTLQLSVPLKVLGLTRWATIPVTLEQQIVFERME
jgi:hypothetical protein